MNPLGDVADLVVKVLSIIAGCAVVVAFVQFCWRRKS